jgi:hypothetical protein
MVWVEWKVLIPRDAPPHQKYININIIPTQGLGGMLDVMVHIAQIRVPQVTHLKIALAQVQGVIRTNKGCIEL